MVDNSSRGVATGVPGPAAGGLPRAAAEPHHEGRQGHRGPARRKYGAVEHGGPARSPPGALGLLSGCVRRVWRGPPHAVLVTLCSMLHATLW